MSKFEMIDIAGLMGIELELFEGDSVKLYAPISKNRNDKGTFFAGSIYSVMVLSGWSLVTSILNEHGYDSNVVIATSSIDYIKPAKDDVFAIASVVEGYDVAKFVNLFGTNNKGKIEIEVELSSGGVICARFIGTYAACGV